MQQGLKDVPFLGAVANIAKKYDDRVNYRNQSPEIRKQMGLQNSYEQKGSQIFEKKSQGKKKRPNANTNNPTYANPQTDSNSLTGSGGSRVRTSDKDWDE